MSKSFRFLTLLLLCLGLAQPAGAKQCYSSQEFEAEQGLRIQSELMVIALNCQHMAYRKGNLYIRYREVARQQHDLFSGYENTLLEYYRRNGSANPESALNDLRTDLANKVAVKSAQMRPDIFCYQHRDRIESALDMNTEQFRQWARTPAPGDPTSQPLCRDRDY